MPSSFAHAAAGFGVAAMFAPAAAPRRYWIAAAVCAVIPDLDYVGAPFGNRTFALLFGGHRGFTHSITFAVFVGALVARFAFRDAQWDGHRLRLWIAFTLATVTHGLLDAATTLGPPIAFFSPFSTARYTFPWHPIDPHGSLLRVIGNELLWVGVPALLLVLLARQFRSAVISSDSACPEERQ